MHPSTGGAASSIHGFEELENFGYDPDEAELLASFNATMPRHGFLPITTWTEQVCQSLRFSGHSEIMSMEELQEIMDETIKSGPPARGQRTFVRMVQNRGW